MSQVTVERVRPSIALGVPTSRIVARAFGLGPLFGSELVASVVGFGVTVLLARRLGASGLADFEYASAVAAWWLVVVRGGFDTIVAREAARRPRLIGPLTNVLLGLRLVSAALAMAAVVAIAGISGGSRALVVVVFGLMLIPSAWAADIGLRASGRFGAIAIAQVVRAVGLLIGVAVLVARPGDSAVAAGCVVAAELGSSLVLLGFHSADHGFPRPRFRRRAWSAIASRGAVASAHRFLRVCLYSADLIVLGLVAGSSLGLYAGARRVSFALLAMGLVVPSALGPRIARAWASGAVETRTLIGRTFGGLAAVVMPATVGLIATSSRWMPCLFGDEYREAGPWLGLIAARLPFVIASNLDHTVLIACRRERLALQLMLALFASGLVLIPGSAFLWGAWGVAFSVLAVEVAGAVLGWLALRGLGLAPRWHHSSGPAIVGCFGVILVCLAGRGWPLGWVVVVAAMVYAVVWRSAGLVGRAAG